MHLNHVVLATALALFVSNEQIVTAGNPDTLASGAAQVDQDEKDDISSASSPVHAAVIAAKTSKTKHVKTPASESGSTEEDSSLDDSSVLRKSDSGSLEMNGSSELDDLFSKDGSDGFDAWLKSLGSKKKPIKTPVPDPSSGDDSNMEDASGSTEEDSSSEDSSVVHKSGSESMEMSGSIDLDDLFSMDGSGGFDAWLKSLGGLGLTSHAGSADDYPAFGSIDSNSQAVTKAPKKKKKADDKSASGSSDTLNFDDFFADMKGSGPGSDLGGLLNPSGEGKGLGASNSSTAGSSSSDNVSPKCDKGWWSSVKSWFGGWIHKSTQEDCPPATRRLRAD